MIMVSSPRLVGRSPGRVELHASFTTTSEE